MHIVQLTQRFYFGRGQEVHVYNLSNELGKLGHKITIFTSDLDQSKMFKDGLQLHPNVTVTVTKGVHLKYPPNQILFPNLANDLLKLNNIDIIHAHGSMSYSSFVGLIVSKTKKIPFIFTPHFHPWRFFEQRPYRYTREAYETMFTIPIIKNSTRTIAVSPFEKKYLVERKKIPHNKIKIIPNGINTLYYPSIVSKRSVSQKYNIPEGKKYIITFGTITDPRKGLDRSLQIFELVNKQIPNSHLLIVGWKHRIGKDYLAKIYDKLASKNNISTLGYVSEDEKIALIKMSDVLISPTSYEAFGIVLGEAMMLKTGVVATNVGGTPSIVKHRKTGLAVGKYNSINKFAKYTIELLKNEQLRLTLGENGKNLVKKYFKWEKIAAQINHIYKTNAINNKNKQK